MEGVVRLYAERVAAERLSPDTAQAAAAERLEALREAISKRRGWFGLSGPAPKGLYLWGAVGRGKSMLMDLFVESLPGSEVRRVHFHAFMLDQHAFLREARAHTRDGQEDLIAQAAKAVAKGIQVLCLDELQITDIADAMLVGRLFAQLLDRGVTLVATSNRAPKDLYKNGLNRQLFLPFIDLIESRLEVLELAAERDYRLERLTEAPVWHTPLGSAADDAMRDAWRRLTVGAKPSPSCIETQGRRWCIACAAAGCARLSFDELCRRPLGPADYLELAEHFHTVLIDQIPRLGPSDREAAARFRTLIDALYEAKTKLVASAAAEPHELYLDGEQAFEFERTASRLAEMRSRDYLAAPRRDAEFKRALSET